VQGNPLAETLQQVRPQPQAQARKLVRMHCHTALLTPARRAVGGVQVYDTSSVGRVLWNDEWPNGTVTFTLAHAKGLQPALPATCGLRYMQWKSCCAHFLPSRNPSGRRWGLSSSSL